MRGKAVVCEVAAAHAWIIIAVFPMIEHKFTYGQLGKPGNSPVEVVVVAYRFAMAVTATSPSYHCC